MTREALEAATEVSSFAALKNAQYSPVSKGLALVDFDNSAESGLLTYNMIVYEGICLGPRLDDGSQMVCLVSDGGETKTQSAFGFTATARTLPRLCTLRVGVVINGDDLGTFPLAVPGKLSELVLTGTKADDIVLATDGYEPSGVVQEEQSTETEDGVPYAWLEATFGTRDPAKAAVKVPGYSLHDLYVSGVDPKKADPLKVTTLAVEADGKVRLSINGYRGENGEGYRILAP